MNFIIYSEVTQSNISNEIGKSEYSYFFVLKEFLPVLEGLGTLHYVTNPEVEVDVIYNALKNKGEESVFISFSPPHKSAINLACPTICVFAWEFDTVPTVAWNDDEKNDWRTVFTAHGRTITLATDTANAVKKAMGDDFPVLVLPTPVWEKMASTRVQVANKIANPNQKTVLPAKGVIFDSQHISLDPDDLLCDAKVYAEVDENLYALPQMPSPSTLLPSKLFMSKVGKRTSEYSVEVAKDEAGFLIYGPYIAWNAGNYNLTIYAHLITPENEPVTVDACCDRGTVILAKEDIPAWQSAYDNMNEVDKELYRFSQFEINIEEDCEDLEIRVWVPRGTVGSIYAIEISPINEELLEKNIQTDNKTVDTLNVYQAAADTTALSFDGVVYTAVMNPKDSRKNLEDLLTAFCWVHKDTEDATLIIKAAQKDKDTYYRNMVLILARLAPFKCRVVCISAFLEDVDYSQLIAVTDYYVNTSLNEGLCIPLIEFLASGVPAIAPNHTAMADYITPDLAFVVESTKEIAAWAHDPEWRRTTIRYRLNWESLCMAFSNSYELAKNNSGGYKKMHEATLNKMSVYASTVRATIELERFINQPYEQNNKNNEGTDTGVAQ